MQIALIDSHQIFTETLRINLLNSLPGAEFIQSYNSIENFLTCKGGHAPHIIITELKFNDRYDKGVDLLFTAEPSAKVIILSSISDDWLIRSHMQSGAKAFLTKTCQFQELLDAIAQVRKGNLFLSQDIQNALSAAIATGKPSLNYLSSIERAILEALSRDEPVRKIAKNLSISMIEFKYHRKMLMERFGLRHFASLVELAKKPGFPKSEMTESQPGAGRAGGKPFKRTSQKEHAMRV